MSLIDKLRIRFGLKWTRPAGWVIAEYAALIFALAVAGWIMWDALQLAIRIVHEHQTAEVRIQQLTAAKDKYEQIIIGCLNDGLVKINGEFKGC